MAMVMKPCVTWMVHVKSGRDMLSLDYQAFNRLAARDCLSDNVSPRRCMKKPIPSSSRSLSSSGRAAR
jgi:hypothetical protein